MDSRITPLTPQMLGNLAAQRLRQAQAEQSSARVAPTEGFSDAFKTALQAVSQTQAESRRLQTEVVQGNPNVSIEETMLTMQKAQIGFQTVLNVRNRMMQAYTDVMNMQV